MAEEDKIKLGDYIIIQRQKYIKLHKFSSKDSTAALGKDQIELKEIENQPYFTTFKILSKPTHKKGRKTSALEVCTSVSDLKEILETKESGIDNRNIQDDGLSQALTAEEIGNLRDSCTSSTEIVGHIIENSKTFNSKTEYAQEKYLKKKEKKYFEYIQIKRPTIRQITEIMYRQDADKIMGMRTDTLSQLISFAGVCATGNSLLYESGTNGLLPATLLNSIGAKTVGQLVHLHPGNVPQKQGLLAMNFEAEQLDRCISVNIYSVLRHFYQSIDIISVTVGTENEIISRKRKLSETDQDKASLAKVAKIDNCDNEPEQILEEKAEPEKPNDRSSESNIAQEPKWKQDNERAGKLLQEGVDNLVIVAKEHPSNLLKALLPFVKPSRPVVIFSMSREILMETYVELKISNKVTNLRLVSNWMRSYQILPNRTHPDVNMSGNSGFLLFGYTVK